MDLISSLASAVGIPQAQAQAVAGLVLGTMKSQVAEQSPEVATQMNTAIPEISGWQAAATALMKAAPQAAPAPGAGGGGFLDDLVSMAGSGLGNQILGAVAGQEAAQGAQLVALLDKLGLTAEHATLAAPVVLQFLKARLGDGTVQQILSFAPMLSGLVGGEVQGGIGSVLSGLLKR